ncbi:hypothetical protein [Streptomyces natalensis]|uniref:Uncharacterized protein n=1 Tax=Streptomyces natalensis ATCC 27448 TaxID=1240678 RepID=A0A0D7CLD5_9ACTN|nr:hypothetical protein [Streptomyces natalensis]KIZ16891.1 hypothetical protein SNA_18105 [Streptomyces natalensis ATCC 27448]
MRQPEPDNPIEQLREFLQLAVPLMIRDLEYRAARGEVSEAWLIGTSRRGGASLGARGDALLFSDRTPRKGRQRDVVTRTTQDLVEGIAAAALLAGPDGIDVFGDHYGPPPGPPPAAPSVPAPQPTAPAPRTTHDAPLTGTYL